MASRSILTKILTLGLSVLLSSDGKQKSQKGGSPRSAASPATGARRDGAGRAGGTETIEVDPRSVTDLLLEYAPRHDDAPDAGEIVWTWVPYVENDGRGKDRPVLVIARHTADRVYAVKLTSKNKQGRDDRLGIGSGPWDSQGRPSWIDTDQLYSVHHDGMRREASALDLDRFTRVASVLQAHFGWKTR